MNERHYLIVGHIPDQIGNSVALYITADSELHAQLAFARELYSDLIAEDKEENGDLNFPRTIPDWVFGQTERGEPWIYFDVIADILQPPHYIDRDNGDGPIVHPNPVTHNHEASTTDGRKVWVTAAILCNGTLEPVGLTYEEDSVSWTTFDSERDAQIDILNDHQEMVRQFMREELTYEDINRDITTIEVTLHANGNIEHEGVYHDPAKQ